MLSMEELTAKAEKIIKRSRQMTELMMEKGLIQLPEREQRNCFMSHHK